jgi:hypothetical protein
MPLQCTSLGLISGNRQFNHELTPYQRGIAISMTFKGAKSTEIEATLNCSRRAIRSTLNSTQLCDEGKTQTQTSTSKCYSDADEQNLLHYIQKN